MKRRFFCSIAFGFLWFLFSLYYAFLWENGIPSYISRVYVWWVIGGIALLPGFLMSAMMFSNIVFCRKKKFPDCCIPTTVVISARDEERHIYKAIKCILQQNYKGPICILVVDNGSKDQTSDIVYRLMEQNNNCRCIQYLYCKNKGKANALNCALKKITTAYFITVDADTYLEKNAVQRIMNHIVCEKSVCVAGNLFVNNAKSTLLTKMQIYDYLLSIAAVKRFQGSYEATLVAQGAFSAYCTAAVREVGGWEDVVGEDIVLTYQLMELKGKSTYEPFAVGYTDVPENCKSFYRQRKRWASGMIEGLRVVPPWKQGTLYSKYFCSVNLSVIYLDLAYIFGFIPGVILAFQGYYYFVGCLTIYTLLISLLLYCSMYFYQKSLKIKFTDSITGFIFFVLFFQTVQSAASLHGYFLQLMRKKVKWK